MIELQFQIEASVQAATFLSESQRDEYRNIAASLTRRLSMKAGEVLHRNVTGIAIYPDADSLTESVAHVDSRAREIQLAGLVIIGLYETGSRRILLSFEPWEDDFTPESRAKNFGHEIGHAIDGPPREFSRSLEWQHIFSQEIRTSRLSGRPLRDAGEAFAEVWSIILTAGNIAAIAELLGINRATQFMSERGLFDET